MDAPRHPVGGVRYGLVGQMGVALGGLDQGMAEQLGDGDHTDAVHGGDRSPVMPQIVEPDAGQTRLVSDAVPVGKDVVDMACRRTGGKQPATILAVSGDGVDHRAGGSGQPDGARPGFGIGEHDALVLDPVPFERGDFADAAPGQQQQADDGGDLRAVELVSGQHGVEPGHFLRRQEPLPGLHSEALGVLGRIGVMGAVSPKLGHAHHDGEDRHGPVGGAGAVGHRSEPVLDDLGRDGVHGQMTEGGQDMIADEVPVGLQRLGLPVAGVAVEELDGEGVHRASGRPGATVVLRRVDEGGDQFPGFVARLGQGHGLGVADGGVAPAPARHAAEGEGARPAWRDSQAQADDHVVADVVSLVAGLGGADTPREGGFGWVGHVAAPCLGPRDRVAVQEAAAAAFLRGSRAAGRDGVSRKALYPRPFPPVHAMAGVSRKGIMMRGRC